MSPTNVRSYTIMFHKYTMNKDTDNTYARVNRATPTRLQPYRYNYKLTMSFERDQGGTYGKV